MYKRNILIYTQNSFLDPLFYGTLYNYLCKINENSNYHFHIVSHEQPLYHIEQNKQNQLNAEFKKFNVTHYPLKWQNGKPRILFKLFEIVAGMRQVQKLKNKYTLDAIITLGSTAASYTLFFNVSPHIAYQFEPQSKFMAEGNAWSTYGLSYNLLGYFERKVMRKAKYMMTATEAMKCEILKINPAQNVLIVPTSLDETKFIIKAEWRNNVRQKLNITDKKVFVYTGKFGDLYYKNEIAEAFALIKENITNAFFLVLTPQPTLFVEDILLTRLCKNDFHVAKVDHSEMPEYLNAADFGVVAIPPTPSQKFRSPIKVGEYLMCGLPYLVCKGISDDDVWAENKDVGVVCTNFFADSIVKVIPKIKLLLEEDPERLRDRCRRTGIEYRGINTTLNAFRQVL